MSRVAKLPQYAAFNDLANCYGRFQSHQQRLDDWLGDQQLMLEVGAGKADLSLTFAKNNPDWQVIALDRKSDRLFKAARATKLTNLAFLQTDLGNLDDLVDFTGRVDLLWLTFPDPYPKKRDIKHRLSQPAFMAIYHKLLVSGGLLRLKTDHHQLFEYSQQVIEADPQFSIAKRSLNLHQELDLPQDATTLTTYEKQFLADKKPIYYLEVRQS